MAGSVRIFALLFMFVMVRSETLTVDILKNVGLRHLDSHGESMNYKPKYVVSRVLNNIACSKSIAVCPFSIIE